MSRDITRPPACLTSEFWFGGACGTFAAGLLSFGAGADYKLGAACLTSAIFFGVIAWWIEREGRR
jgi:hypothetical protein